MNAQQDHVPDPLAHLGYTGGMKGRSWNCSTKLRPGYIRGPQSLSEPCDPSSSSHDPSGSEAISGPAVLEAISTTAGMDPQALSAAAAHALLHHQMPLPSQARRINEKFEELAAETVHNVYHRLTVLPD